MFLRPSLSGRIKYKKLLGTDGIVVIKKLKCGVPVNLVPMYRDPAYAIITQNHCKITFKLRSNRDLFLIIAYKSFE